MVGRDDGDFYRGYVCGNGGKLVKLRVIKKFEFVGFVEWWKWMIFSFVVKKIGWIMVFLLIWVILGEWVECNVELSFGCFWREGVLGLRRYGF